MQRLNDYLRLRMPGPVMDAINREIPHIVQGVGDTLSEVLKGMVLASLHSLADSDTGPKFLFPERCRIVSQLRVANVAARPLALAW